MRFRGSGIFVGLALLHCQSGPARPSAKLSSQTAAPSRSASPIVTPEWSPTATLDACADALAKARLEPVQLARASELNTSCMSMIRHPSCRELAKKQAVYGSGVPFSSVLEVCAKDYCPELSEGPSLAACRGAVDGDQPRLAWVALRQAMLRRDFPEADWPRLSETLLGVAQYMSEVPPPSVLARDRPPADLEIRIKTDHTWVVSKKDASLTSISSAAELAKAIPRCDGTQVVALSGDPGTDYQQIIDAIDALREIGCERVQFGVAKP